MAFHYSPHLPNDQLCFLWNPNNYKCYNYYFDVPTGTQTISSTDKYLHVYDKVTGARGYSNRDQYGIAASFLDSIYSLEILANPNNTANEAYLYWDSNEPSLDLPEGDEASFLFKIYVGSYASTTTTMPLISKAEGNNWSGTNGFIIGFDPTSNVNGSGLNIGIGGTHYDIGASTGLDTGWMKKGQHQIFLVTYKRNTTNGLKTYLWDKNGTYDPFLSKYQYRLIDQRNTSNSAIGSNNNDLRIGGSSNYPGQYRGNIASIMMWKKALNEKEVDDLFNEISGPGTYFSAGVRYIQPTNPNYPAQEQSGRVFYSDAKYHLDTD